MDNTDPAKRPEPTLSRAGVGRLSLYLRRLEDLQREGTPRVSSSALGLWLGLTDTQVRKDLAGIGNLGHPGVGYDVPELIRAIRATLGIDREWRAALVGVGNLARALLRYNGFLERGFRIVALFDADPKKVGTAVEGITVNEPSAMRRVIESTGAEIGILTVPAPIVQNVADELIAAGVRGLVNFAPGVVKVPAAVSYVNVDLTVQLEQLAYLIRNDTHE